MNVLIALAVVLFAAKAEARMICHERPSIVAYHFAAEEQAGGTCGPLKDLIVYAPRNNATFFDFSIASAESKLSENKCVERIEGMAWHGIQWQATESWSTDGSYGLAHYKISQEWDNTNCESEYTVRLTPRKSNIRLYKNGNQTSPYGQSSTEISETLRGNER